MIFACSHLLVAAHYGTPEQCEFLEKVERLRVNAQHDEALQTCNLKLLELGNQPNQSFYLKVAHEKAGILFALGDFEAARDFLRPLKNLQENNNEDFKAAWGDCMYALGKAYDLIEKSDSAIYFFKLALNVRLDLEYPDHEKLANNYSYLGYIYRFVKGEYSVAEKYYLKEGGELLKFRPDIYTVVNHHLNLAACISDKDFERALNYNFKALSYIADEGSENALRSNCLNNIANIYYRTDDFDKAVKYYHLSLQSAFNQSEGNSESNVTFYENLGLGYEKMGKLDSARLYIGKALEINREVHGPKSKEVAESLIVLSAVTSDERTARQLRIQAMNLKFSHYKPHENQIRAAYSRIAMWFYGRNEVDSALYFFQKALRGPMDNYAALPDIDSPKKEDVVLAFNLRKKAELLFEYGKQQDSLPLISASVNHFTLLTEMYDALLQRRNSETEQLSFVENSKEVYDKAVEASYYLHQETGKGLEELWFFMEKCKSAVLMLQAQTAIDEFGNSKEIQLLEKKRKLVGEAKYFEEILRQTQGDSIRLVLFGIYKSIDSLNGLMETTKSTYGGFGNVIELDEVRNKLRQKKQSCIIETHIAPNEMYVMKVNRDTVRVSRLVGQDFLTVKQNSVLLRLILSGATRSKDRRGSYSEFTKVAVSLYNSILAPLDVGGVQDITVIADGFLNALPFEVFLTGKPKSTGVDYRSLPYLLKRSIITYGYSASWLIKNQIEASETNFAEKRLLAFAYSDGNDESGHTGLPASETEVKVIQNLWNNNFKSFVGDAASEKNFKSFLGEYEIVHLATHNLVDEKKPLNSGLVFRRDETEDGVLHVFEIYQLLPKTKMVVLSACESAIGEYNEGEGFLSVGRAFAQRGTPFIVSSLWKASDSHSKKLMSGFYKEITLGTSPVVALHKSKMGFLQESDELTAHPSNWASFISVGGSSIDSTSRDMRQKKWPIWIGLGFLILAFWLFFWVNSKS